MASRPESLTVGTVGQAWPALVEAVGVLLDGRPRLWALEAGAGTRTLFDLPEGAYVVGIDRDLRALGVNARLDQRVPVDLVDHQPQAAGFDLISCWYVLDGLADPAVVLDRFARWTAPGGLVVLRWTALQVLVRMLSLGFLDAASTDYVVVFRRGE